MTSFESDEQESPPAPARQNPILRAYFRKQYVKLRIEQYDLNQALVEKYVDRQIDAFLYDVDARLEQLVEVLSLAEQEHRALLLTGESLPDRTAKRRLAEALKEVQDSAGGLKGKLANVFVRLDGKEKLPIEVSAEDGYRKEMLYLKDQVCEAERRIRDYLFRSTNTVPYENLKGENLLIRLYWAEKTAGKIREQLLN